MRDRLKENLEAEEGRCKKVYKCTEGKNTIAIGRNLDANPLTPEEEKHLGCTTKDLLAGKLLTDEQIDYLFENGRTKVQRELDREIPWWRGRPETVQLALQDMCFQMGIDGLLGFKKMLACVHAGDWEGAKKNAKDSLWATQTPKRAERVTALFTAGHPFN